MSFAMAALMILVLILPMSCTGLDILDRGIPRSLSNEARRAVLGGFATLVNAITPFVPYTAGRTFSDTIKVGGRKIFLRLWFFVNPDSDNGEGCSTTPTQGDTAMGFNLVTAFREIHDEIGESIIQWGYSFLTAINRRFGMEYVVEDATEEQLVETEMPSPQGLILINNNNSFSSYWTMPEFRMNSPVYSSSDDCFPFGSLLRSGHAGVAYTQLDSGYSLKSPNGLFMLTMQTDCNLVLYDEDGTPHWASGTQGRGSGCYSRMQIDGNLVINTSQQQCIWAINMYVEGEIISSVLAVQDDRNVVVYRADYQSAVWATNTQI